MNRLFDRDGIAVKPLSARKNKLDFSRDHIDPAAYAPQLDDAARASVEQAAAEIRAARAQGAPAILAFGAHSIKNGLSPVLVRLMRGGWITHFATNGAGVIHDWEFAFQGFSGEDVKRYVGEGQFGGEGFQAVHEAADGGGNGEAGGCEQLAQHEGDEHSLAGRKRDELVALEKTGDGVV